ncbi:hypothetical protein VHEMI05462 [[Torrubiella] hemipterigena]|uniref:Extracellular membrane protein CFEM domain-containing protein n=1 Tax=[Torrubiella] hemipterigena TaxID=1531966 RepID=A0A0A1TH27_9HYPO|nr:hypothetical protein VHEMI05462 [[Torrubiella] hemipterigena]
MKTFAIISLAIATALAHAPSLTELTNGLPACAASAMNASMQEQKCNVAHVDATAFDCLCNNYYDVTGGIFDKVPYTCAADFARDAGALCGVWAVEGPSASDIKQAVEALAAKVGGSAQ